METIKAGDYKCARGTGGVVTPEVTEVSARKDPTELRRVWLLAKSSVSACDKINSANGGCPQDCAVRRLAKQADVLGDELGL